MVKAKQVPIFTRNEEQKAQFKALATSKGITMVDLLDLCIDQYDGAKPMHNKDTINSIRAVACAMLQDDAKPQHVIWLLRAIE